MVKSTSCGSLPLISTEGRKKGRGIVFFVDADGEAALGAVVDDGVGDAVVAPDAGEARADVI